MLNYLIEKAISLVFSGTGRPNSTDGGNGLATLSRGILGLNNELVLKTDTSGRLVGPNPATASQASFFNPDLHIILTATRTVLASENGATFYLNSATEFATTLPAPFLGARYTFIVKAAPASASYTIVTASSANIIKGTQYVCADAAGDAGTADDTITLVDGQAVAGDRVELWSDGTSWFANAFTAVAAGLTFTQETA